jgi:hypothetical protein
MNSHAGGRRVRGTSRDASVGKVRGPGLELDLVDVETEAVSRDLGQRRPGALLGLAS